MKNLEMLALAAEGLGPLKDEVVFVGGATIELYLAGQSSIMVRATDDVDCVVEVATRGGFHKLEERLRGPGFRHPQASRAPICRWEFKGILIDVMPIDGAVLGFTNRWYPEGFETGYRPRSPMAGGYGFSRCPTSWLQNSRLSRAEDTTTSSRVPTWRTS